MKRILGLMMAIIMIMGVLPVISYADGTGQSLDAAVEFASEYLKTGDNDYRVFGKNNSAAAQTVQTVRALYSGGTLTDVTYGVPFSVASGEEFAVSQTVTVPEGTEVSNSNLKVYLWDSADNFMPLSKEFSQRGVSFEFTLSEGANTSAGVYDKDGKLVRTLWSAVYYDKGTHTGKWDGLDDELNITDGGEYTVKVISHNVKYEQDALLANSTAREKADTMMTSYQPISDMTLLGDNMYYADQYMENYYTLMYFNINDIHRKAGYFEQRGNRVPIRNTNDGETVYWMMFETTPSAQYDTSVYGVRRCFIMGVDVSTNSQVIFDEGQSLWDYWGANSETTYESAIGYEAYLDTEGVGHYSSSADAGYGDITVQQQGNFLVATYGSRDFVRVIDKTTGKTLKDNPLAAPTAVLFDNQDRLWAAYTDSNGAYAVSRFDIGADGTMTLVESVPSANIKGETLAMEFSPDGSYVVFVFGDGSDKMYAYSLSDWSEKWTWGRGEDYSTDPTVYDDKFMFRDTVGGRKYSFLEFEGSDYLWVGDPGNDRNHKLYVGGESAPTISDTLWFSKQHYSCSVDAGDPTRVFFGSKEFKIDYTKDGDESWTLVRNYMDIIAPYITESSSGMLYGLTTASNGRTYFAGIVRENAEVSGSQYERSTGDKVIYELTSSGIRDAGAVINDWSLLNDGNMTLQMAQKHNLNGVSGTALYRKALSGFDSNGNPYWGEKEMIAFMSTATGSWNAMGSNTAVTDNGIVFPIREGYYSNVYRTADNMRDFRMGGFKAEASENTQWLFKAAPATTANYGVRTFPRDGAVEINTWYDLSGEAQAYGDNVITHYRGEGYLGGQANIFYHYLDNGLLIGVFGAATYQQAKYENYGQELVNGNGFCWQITFPDGKDGDTAYLYQGGEARMSGVVRMKITGLNSVKTQEIPVALGSPYRNGVLVTSYNQTDLSNTSEIDNTIRYDFTLPEDVDANGSVKFETYIKAPQGEEGVLPLWIYSDGNVKVVYDSTEEVSGSGVIAKNITVSSDDYKKLTIYVTPKDGALSYFSLKGEINGVKTDIPTKYFCAVPSVSRTARSEYNLIEDLPFDSSLSGQMAGWNFENWVTGSNTAVTNEVSYDYMKGSSLSLKGAMLIGENISAERDLGIPRYDMSAWEISTEISMLGVPNGYYAYAASGGNIPGEQGKYLDILDQNGKIIARITLEDDFTLRLNDKVIMQTDNNLSSLDRKYLHELTVPSELKIYTQNGQITANYRGNSVVTGVYESGADWKAPKTLKVSAFKDCRNGPHAVTMTTEFTTLNYTQYAMDTPCFVNFYSDDKTTLIATIVVEKGEAATPPDAYRVGYVLSWDKDISCVTEDMDVYAIYTADDHYYSVKFYDGETLLKETGGLSGDTVSYTPEAKDGYAFIEWVDADGNTIDLTIQNKDIVAYAKWRKIIVANETFNDMHSRIRAVTPYQYTDSTKSTIGNIFIGGFIANEAYAIHSYTKNDDGTYSNVVQSSAPFSNLQGTTGFTNEYIYARANSGSQYCHGIGFPSMAGKDGTSSTVIYLNGAYTQLNYNKFRLYFDDIDSKDKLTVSYDLKINNFNGNKTDATASMGGFGDIIDTNCDGVAFPPKSTGVSGNGRIIKGRCDAAYGFAIWNSKTQQWVTLISSSDTNATEWNTIKYDIDMAAKTFKVYVNDTLKGTLPFAMEAETINAIEFNLLSNGESNQYYLDNITLKNNQ